MSMVDQALKSESTVQQLLIKWSHLRVSAIHTKVRATLYHKTNSIKVLFSSFPKNGHTAWFDPQTKKLAPHCITKQT